jgi:chemotaxis protein CheD
MRPQAEKEIQLCEYLLKPGYIFLSRDPVIISSVLGSCVAVSLWDGKVLCGGMAHYLFPVADDGESATAKFGNVAVSYLAGMFFREGAFRRDLRAQLFGGASISKESLVVAEENIEIAKQVLGKLNIKIVSEDVGGDMGRKLIYNTLTNEAIVFKANRLRKGDWYPYHHARRRT